MRIAILLYGYFYVDHAMDLWRAPHSKNQLKKYSFVQDGYPEFIKNVYIPIKELYGDGNVDVYMITHEFSHPRFDQLKNELINTCKNFTIFFTNKVESPRLPYTYWNLANKVSNVQKYDRYFITRGDLIYKNKITHFFPRYTQNDACWFVFKDYKEPWEDLRIISDIMFIIDNNIEKFKRSVAKQISLHPERTEMHGIYYFLRENFGQNLSFMVDGHYDSNTATKAKEGNNPVYIMFGRPYYFGNISNDDQNEIKRKLAVPPMQNIKTKPGPVQPPINTVPTTKTSQIVELYKQRINGKMEKQLEQRTRLANIVPKKVKIVGLRQNTSHH